MNSNKSLFEEQVGFRDGYSTVDQMFTLDFICNYYVKRHKRLYVAFIDYKKAFDCIDRISLWRKVINLNIKGPVINVIFNLYQNAKSCVKHEGKLSEYFESNIGVRQGECLSPLLFAIFLNDLIPHVNQNCNGLIKMSTDINEKLSDPELDQYFKLYILLYADDTVLMSENPEDLQSALNAMSDYCDLNKLEINTAKTKVMVCSKGKIRKLPNIFYKDTKLDVVFSFPYLGLSFNYNAKLKVAQNELLNKASRAMFGLISKSRNLNLPLDIQLSLFDSIVKPVMLYGSEIWGPQNCNLADKLQIRYLKLIMDLKKRTPTIMVRGETGSYPISIDITCRVLNYWFNLVNCENANKLTKVMYNYMLPLFTSGEFIYPWLNFVKTTLDNLGMSFIFDNQTEGVNYTWFKKAIKLKLTDCYKQEWAANIQNNQLCNCYKIYKFTFNFEPYLIRLPTSLASAMLKLRTRNVPGLINTMFNQNLTDNSVCPLCHENDLNEIHLLLNCAYLTDSRKSALPHNSNRQHTKDFLIRFMRVIRGFTDRR